jgi:RNA polymerase sigma-70 factor (ECF subfamily)
MHETLGDDDVLAQIPASNSTEAAVGARIDLERLENALASLPEHYRSTIVLRDVYGLSIDEISKQLKISEPATKVRLHRGRKRLKDLMYGDDSKDEER